MAKFSPGSIRQFWLLTIGLFLTVSLVTGAFEAASDGYNKIGFPLRFYSHTGGKCQECENFWHWSAFLLDLGCCVLAGWLGSSLHNQLKS